MTPDEMKTAIFAVLAQQRAISLSALVMRIPAPRGDLTHRKRLREVAQELVASGVLRLVCGRLVSPEAKAYQEERKVLRAQIIAVLSDEPQTTETVAARAGQPVSVARKVLRREDERCSPCGVLEVEEGWVYVPAQAAD